VAEPLTTIRRTADGRVWLLGGGHALEYAKGAVSAVALPIGSAAVAPVDLEAAAGKLWVATSKKLTVLNDGRYRVFGAGQEFGGARLLTLLAGHDGTAWIGTDRGLFLLTAGAKAPEKAPWLGSEAVLSLCEDAEGNVWAGSGSSGLHVLRPRTFAAEPPTAGEGTTAVVESTDGAIVFGTRDRGVFRLGSAGAVPIVPISALTSPVILSLAPGLHGDLWAGTPDGLNHIEGGRVRRYTAADGLPDDFVRSVYAGRDGTVWVGTRHGLAHLRENGAIRTLTRADGLGSDSIGPMLGAGTRPDAGGDPWVGTAAGLTRLHDGKPENFSPNRDGSGAIVTALVQDGVDGLWVALHHGGLAHFRGGRFQPVRSRALPEEIAGLALDRAGFLWLRATRGVYRVPAGVLAACGAAACDASVSRYGTADGLPSDEITAEGMPSLWPVGSGELLFATRKGLAQADGLHVPVNRVPPPVAIERFAVDDVGQSLTGNPVQIDSGHHSFTFDYAGLSYTLPSKNRYRYMLEGFDRDWVDAGARRTAYYTSLPGRRYRFRVLAANNDGIWNETGAELRFSVRPPFYLRPWFYALAMLALAAAVLLLLQLRVQRVRGQFALVLNERNRVAREIHDTLAQDLVSVSLQLELLAQMMRANKLEPAAETIRETRALVKKGLDDARQSIWDLRANVTEGSLPAQIRRAAEQLADRLPATQVKVGGAYRKLDPTTEKEVLRITQESLLNVERHAAATGVLVSLQYGSDSLRLEVKDDGVGFSHAEARHKDGHYGVRGMEERAAALGGELTIASMPGQGTTVALNLPLPCAQGSGQGMPA
jgi:signal transduction histidine kinase